MARQIFRKVALERLSSPEQLDQLMQAASPKSWAALLTLLFLLGVALVWGVKGVTPTKVNGQGILVSKAALTSITSLSSGQIELLYVQVDDDVHEGQVVARLMQPETVNELVDARNSLELLEKEQEMTKGFGKEVGTLKAKNIEEQRKTLLTSIEALEKRAKHLKAFADHYRELMEKEFVTFKEYADAQSDYDNVLQEINTNRAKLIELSATKVDSDSQRKKEDITLTRRIMEARDKVEILENKLEKSTKIISPYSGRVTEIYKNEGMLVSEGEPLLTLEQGGRKKELAVIAYFPPYDGKQIRPGMIMGVAPSVIKREEFGFILGDVTYVSSFPASSDGMQRVLRNRDLVNTLSEGGAPIMVKAELQLDPDTPSGYRWSSGKGPDLKIYSGTLCDVNVVVKEQPPITLVIPFLKRTFLGVGDERLEREG